MASTALALPETNAPAAEPGQPVRIVVQRAFLSPDQRGGSIRMWSNVACFWAARCDEPPRVVAPDATGDAVGAWLACTPFAGVDDGCRVWMHGEAWRVDRICRLPGPPPELRLRLVRAAGDADAR